MQPFSVRSGRVAEVMRVVARVHDPELDEPVTDMGFIEKVEVADDGSVELDFRLPTYWCSPNFAFLMLDGVREALESLSWRPPFRITLHDHLFAEEVNSGRRGGQAVRRDLRDAVAAGRPRRLARDLLAQGVPEAAGGGARRPAGEPAGRTTTS